MAPLFLWLLLAMQQAPAQQKTELTVRADVNLVQTDVMVFGRDGKFVPGLQLEQFELEVDGKRHPVSFCELVSSGTGRDSAAWAPTPGGVNEPVRLEPASADMGRRLIFFIDDWHLSGESLIRTRAALENLIRTSIGVNDLAGIFPASGSTKFLQQLTDNRRVLEAALERMTFFNTPIVDKETVPMNESQALAIELNDPDVLNYFIDATIAQTAGRAGRNRAMIERIVRRRAAALASQANETALRTLASLARTVRTFAPMPGRKVIYLLSDGFVLQHQNTDVMRGIREVTGAAATAGIVIYSLDTRGLIVGGPDASNPVRPDTSNRLARAATSEVLAAQDALNALAADSGGEFLKNTNALDAAIAKTLAETSRYYLLGWYLDRGMLQPGQYRSIRVSVKGRPDLKVRVRQGKVDLTQLAVQGSDGTLKANPATKDPSEALLRLLKSQLPVGVLPVSFFAGYDLKSDKGFSLSIALQTTIEDAQVKAPGAGVEHRIDLAGMVLNTEGETVTSFADALAVPPADANSGPREWIYSGALPMKPGLYQVRIAVRDSWTGRSASAIQWLDVPGLSESRIVLGSAFLAETSGAARPDIFDGNSISIRRRFRPSSQVSYFLHVYDLERKPLVYQTRLFRSNSIVSESGFQPLASPDAPAMVTGRLPLESLPPGGYTLEITVKDSSRSPVAQQVRFWIE